MICYNCGRPLSEHDFCTGCGVDVSLYKKVIYLSNRLYNDGLEKASVRDLSGAIISLKESIKLNKNNIEARNLLGLVYFEMGEVVSALREWVISQNLRPKKNIADDYIDMIQNNQTRLEGINQTIKKYNQALAYCYQDSQDLAVIQLKKVLSNNPRYVRAHQLLALLYMNTEEWERAQRELIKCQQIDNGNTLTSRYLSEVEQMLSPEDAPKGVGMKKKAPSEDVIRYQSGNETIIQPVNRGERKGAASILNLGIGLVIGVMIAVFLILPARIQSAKSEINSELRVVSEQSDAKTATIDEQEQQIQTLTDENAKLSEQLSVLEGTDGALQVTDGLMMAVNTYLTDPENTEKIAEYMETLEVPEGEEEEKKTESFETLRKSFVELMGEKLAAYYYGLGNDSYREENYAEAIPNLQRAFEYDETNLDALFYLGNSYRETGDTNRAKEIYAQIIDDFPNTERASKAETYLAEINNEN